MSTPPHAPTLPPAALNGKPHHEPSPRPRPEGQKLKIVYVVTRMIIGGAQETAKATAEHFHQRGDEVLLVTGTEAGREGQFEVDAPTLDMPSMVRRLSPRQDAKTFVELVKLFRRLKPDIVHARTAKARFLAPLAARVASVPVVVQTIHGFSFNNEIDKKRALYIALERFVARFCHCNIMVSETDRAQGYRLGILRHSTTRLIRSGVNVAKMRDADASATAQMRAQFAPAGDEFVFVLVGRLSPPKTPEVFVEAAAQVLAAEPRARFVLVGDGAKREALEARIAELKIGEQVRLLGLRSDVGAIVAASDAVAHCSTHEGLPKTVLEGMAAGKPVIASNVGGVPVVVEDGESGLLVPASDDKAMAQAMLRLLREPGLREKLVAGANARLQEFSLDKTLADTEELYAQLLKRRR